MIFSHTWAPWAGVFDMGAPVNCLFGAVLIDSEREIISLIRVNNVQMVYKTIFKNIKNEGV
jgi:hypothetical protein